MTTKLVCQTTKNNLVTDNKVILSTKHEQK